MIFIILRLVFILFKKGIITFEEYKYILDSDDENIAPSPNGKGTGL